MKYIKTITLLAATYAALAISAAPAPCATPRNEILVCTSDTASPAIKAAVDDLAKDAAQIPALHALMATQNAGPVVRMSSEAVLKDYDLSAYNHLVVVGLISADPLLAKSWGSMVSIDEAGSSLYAQGWGHLHGAIGTVASNWNPFLHSQKIKSAPMETVEIKISGTSGVGVLTAVKAFESGLDNGLVPAGSVTRPTPTILDLDPYVAPPPMALPQTVAATGAFGDSNAAQPMLYAGWTQCPANEYRAYIDVGGTEPVHVWRAKYLQPGVFDEAWTPQAWVDGLHPMAYGNAVTIAQFASAAEASKTAVAMGKSSGWRPSSIPGATSAWTTAQPVDEVLPQSYGSIFVWAQGSDVILCSLPSPATAQIAAAH